MPAKVYHYDLFGKRKDKYEFLASNSVSTVDWTELEPDPKYHFFVPKDFSLQKEWEKGVKISELFEEYNSGIQTKRDKITVSDDELFLNNIIKDFNLLDAENIRFKYSLPKDGRDWTIDSAKDDVKNNNPIFVKYCYKPFDFKKIIYTGKTKGIVAYPRNKTSCHFIKNKNISLNLMRSQVNSNNFSTVQIVDSLSDINFYGFQTYNFPLYLYPDNEDVVEEGLSFQNPENGDIKSPLRPKPNFNPKIIKQIEEQLGMELDWEAGIGESLMENGELRFTPTDLLDYIYAVLHSPNYREKYKEFLKIDFPRIPFLNNNEQIINNNERFWRLVKLGGELRKLHLMEGINPLELEQAEISGEGENLVEKIKFENGKVWINDTKYFDNVPETAWNFYIGGYQPAQKWLKDRKGRQLSFDDILHYQKIVWVLGETGRVMGEIDN